MQLSLSGVRGIARKFLKNPITIDKVTGEENKASLTVSHRCMVAPNHIEDKAALIGHLITQFSAQRCIVFTRTKMEADEIANSASLGVEARALHGDVQQSRREKIMADFKSGRFGVLVATDVAARGVDIPAVELVIQAAFPQEAESYIHRSGRTGRAGRSGTSVILYTPFERRNLAAFSRAIGTAIEPVYPNTVGRMSEEDIEKAMEQSEKEIAQHRRHSAPFVSVAEKLLAKYNTTALAAFLTRIYGQNQAPRSMLTSQANRVTVAVKLNSRNVEPNRYARQRIAQILGLDSISTYMSELINGTIYVDIPAEHALNLINKLEADEAADDVSLPSKLPAEFFRGAADRNYESTFEQGRGSGSMRGGSRFGGSSSKGSFGGRSRFGDEERSPFRGRGGRDSEFRSRRSFDDDRNSAFGQGSRGKRERY